MTRKGAARTQREPGLARMETEKGTGRKARPVRKTTAPGPEATTPEPGPAHEAAGTGAPLPPPHPALIALVRILAQADARRARLEERGMR